MTSADTWAELARQFREKPRRYRKLRHVLIELPEAYELPSNPDDEQAMSEAIARANRLRPALDMAAIVELSPQFRGCKISLVREHLGQRQFFYGEPAGRDAPSWQRFVELAHIGVNLASGSGLITPPPLPELLAIEEFHWAGTWADLLYRLARERPESSLQIQEWSKSNGKRFPDGMRVAKLVSGVFIASAYAAEILARDVETPPGPKSGLSISGNKVTVDGIIYHLDDGPAAFVRELVGAGVGFWISGPKMGPMVKPYPSRIRKQIEKDHPEIAAWIESSTFKGFRLLSQRQQDKTKNGPR
jgi:hypothetical protein